MKLLIGLIALLFTTSAFAQTAPPKAAKRPSPVQVKPPAPIGCKLVGTVRGTKLWAGDCAAAVPAAETPPPAQSDGVSAPAEKQ
jgi:hypothetical protein